MSLHIGNLSSRIRPDDLERVFRRFGKCTIRIKEKYGFIVYEYPASAERALKTLKGTRICGEALNLSWSKHQPTAPNRFSAGGQKLHDPPRRRYTVRDNADRRQGSTDRRVDSKESDAEAGKRLSSFVFVGDSNSDRPFDLNPCMAMSDCKNFPQDDRWGGQVVVPTNVKCVENGTGFDQYDGMELDGRRQESPPVRSPSVGAEQMFEKKGQRDKEPPASRNHQRSTVREGSFNRNKRDYSEGAKSLSSSSFHSDYTSSRSRSRSRTLRSLFESPSPSNPKSVPSKKVSESSPLRSSPSCHSGTKTLDSGSTSKSKSHNSSLLPFENESKDYVESDVGVVSSRDLKKSENVTSAVENELESRPAKVGQEEDTEKDISETNEEDSENDSKDYVENDIGFTCKDLKKSENVASAVENELGARPAKLEQEGTEKDVSETNDEAFAEEHKSAAESDISKRSTISSEEMCMVLKHYGLQCPDDKEMDLPVETFFGSARLWPWEMIYYRRLKKGSISVENYSRRVAQNHKFGIVDKYIRGSSGWEELN